MLRLTPLLEDARNVRVGTHPDIDAADHQIMSRFGADVVTLVGFDAFVLVMPLCEQQADGTFDDFPESTFTLLRCFHHGGEAGSTNT